MTNIKWLLAGAGDIARRRAAAALREAANSVITAICDPVSGKAADLAERMGVNAVFTDYAQALDQSGADAVYIASPVFCHHDMCIMAAEHGIPFLCEKPLALCGAEAARILRAAKRNKVTAACSNYRVFCGQYQLTRQIIESGEVGALRGGRACYIQMPFNPNRRQLREASAIPRCGNWDFTFLTSFGVFWECRRRFLHAVPLSRATMTRAGISTI